jgi:hypothetical protein
MSQLIFDASLVHCESEVVEAVDLDLSFSCDGQHITVFYFGGNVAASQLTHRHTVNCVFSNVLTLVIFA